jgi:hypothetical protein
MAIDILGLGISIDTSPLKGLAKLFNDVGKSANKMADDIDKSAGKTIRYLNQHQVLQHN